MTLNHADSLQLDSLQLPNTLCTLLPSRSLLHIVSARWSVCSSPIYTFQKPDVLEDADQLPSLACSDQYGLSLCTELFTALHMLSVTISSISFESELPMHFLITPCVMNFLRVEMISCYFHFFGGTQHSKKCKISNRIVCVQHLISALFSLQLTGTKVQQSSVCFDAYLGQRLLPHPNYVVS